jgi:type IV secretory pathway protease TraF
MKKIFVILLLAAAGFALQSCGGGEKCPTYTENAQASEAIIG